MKILIVANRCPWASWPEKIKELKTWFLPLMNLDITLEHTNYIDIPFVEYNAQKSWLGVTNWWYDLHISSQAKNYAIVLLVLPLTQWPLTNRARGWRTDKLEGPVELQIAADEGETAQWPNFPVLGTFFQETRHELVHALYMITGQSDRTHEFWDQGKLELALTDIKFPVPKNAELISAYQKLLSLYQQLLNLISMPKQYLKIEKFCLAIQKMEGWQVGSKSFCNNNPGNLRFVGQSRATGQDKNGFAIFPNYEAGFETLKEMVIRACEGKSKIYKANSTIYDFFAIYAPAEDNNKPRDYAEFVAFQCNVLPSMSISGLLL